MRPNSLILNVLITAGTRVAFILATFLGTVITARYLSPAERGYFFFATTLAATVAQFGNFGLHSSNIRYLAEDQSRLPAIAGNSLLISLVIGLVAPPVIGGILSSGLYDANVPVSAIALGLILAPFVLYYQLGSSLLVGLERFRDFNKYELLNRFLGLALMIACAILGGGVNAFILTVVVSMLAVCFLLWKRVNQLGRNQSASWSVFRMMYRFGFKAYLAGLLPFLMTRQIVYVLGNLDDKNELGYWSIAYGLGVVLMILPGSVATILFPRLVKTKNSASITSTAAMYIALIMLFTCGVVAFMADFLIEKTFGANYLPAVKMLYWYLPTVFCLSVISIFSQLLAARGMPISLLVVWVGGNLINFVLASMWAEVDGAIGVVKAVSVSHVFVLLGVMGLVYRLCIKQNEKN